MRILFLVAFAIISITISCTKISSTDVGSGLIPAVDNVNTFDTTLDVVTNTMLNPYDPVVNKGDDHVIGVLNDPIFGTTRAAAFFELKPTVYPYSFPFNPQYRVVDSAVLILNFRGLYGDTSAAAPQQNWEVVELADSLKGDTLYRVSINPTAGAVIGTATIDVRKLKDSVKNKFESSINQVRIKLSDAFATRLIKQYDSTNAYKSDVAFRAAFKGFGVRPTGGSAGNTLVRVNLLDQDTKLGLYYHKDSSNKKSDTSANFFRFSLFTGETSLSANRIVRNFSGSELANALNVPGNAEKVYALTSPGTYINVAIPGLSNLSNRIIHRAELLAYQDAPDNDPLAEILAPPRYLLLARFDTALKVLANVPNDYEITQSGPNIESFGGYLFYQNIAGFNKASAVYDFNISRYVQGIVSRGDSNFPLRIYAPSNDSMRYSLPYPNNNVAITNYITPALSNRMAEGRVRLAGGAHPNPRIRMRVRIIYSRL